MCVCGEGGRALSSRSAPGTGPGWASGGGGGEAAAAGRAGWRAGLAREPGGGRGQGRGAREPCQAQLGSRRARRGEPSATACCGDAPVDVLAAGRTA